MRVLHRSRQNDRLLVMLVLVHIDIIPPHTPLPVFRRIGERTIPYSWRACTFELTLTTFHRVDVLINNAGILLEQDPHTLLSVNLLGPIIGCQTAFKYMGKSKGGKGGMVINMSSILGFVPFSATPAYVASKHGLIGLTRSYGLPYHLEKEGASYLQLFVHLIQIQIS
ncbi:15-hydroxyprostaglandin dehydrogenase [Trichonephila clavipes]|nr:15-hydroxyprostaglandin dehydrogenase [Trichonephila clavipes]